MIADSLNKLKEIKSDIKQALSSKGVEVGDKFDEYADGIEKINEGSVKVPEGMKFSYSTLEEFPKEFDWSDSKNWTDFSELFSNCSNLKEYPVLDTSSATSMSRLFYSSSIKSLPNWNWDTSNVIDMSGIFLNCNNLIELDLSNLDTSNVTNINSMVGNCQNIETLSEIDVIKVTSNQSSSSGPLNYCVSLRNFGGLKNCKVTYYANTCYSLSYESLLNMINGLADGVSGKTLYLTQDCVNQLNDSDIEIATNKGWSISPAKTITETIVVIDLSVIPSNTQQITPKTYDFSQFSGRVGGGSTSALPCYRSLSCFEGSFKDASSLAKGFCSSTLKYADITLDTNSFDCNYLFNSCNSLREIKIKTINGASVNSAFSMFGDNNNNSVLSEVDLSNVEFSGEVYGMFNNAYKIKKIILPDNFGRNATILNQLFYWCQSLEEVDLSKFNTTNITSMRSMFARCELLKEIDLTGWDLSKVENMNGMVGGCYSLTKLTMTGNVSNVTNVDDMFNGITTNGTFYYNPDYDYSKIIAVLPDTWEAVPLK